MKLPKVLSTDFYIKKENLSKKDIALKIISSEVSLTVPIFIDGLDFPINIKGIVDRIDVFDNQLRIIDYKTGKVEQKDLKIKDMDEICQDSKYGKAIQVLLYTYMFQYQETYFQNEIPEAGIISFKNLKAGVMAIDFGNAKQPDKLLTNDRIEAFMEQIKDLIKEIFDPSIPFIEKETNF